MCKLLTVLTSVHLLWLCLSQTVSQLSTSNFVTWVLTGYDHSWLTGCSISCLSQSWPDLNVIWDMRGILHVLNHELMKVCPPWQDLTQWQATKLMRVCVHPERTSCSNKTYEGLSTLTGPHAVIKLMRVYVYPHMTSCSDKTYEGVSTLTGPHAVIKLMRVCPLWQDLMQW